MINTVKVDSRQLRAIFLPIGVWCLWTFFVLSILYALVANTSKPMDLVIAASVLALFALWLPINSIVIDKNNGVITITSKRLFSKVVTIKPISSFKTLDIIKGLGNTGAWFLSLTFSDEKIVLIAPDMLPSHLKKMEKKKAIIEQFLKYS